MTTSTYNGWKNYETWCCKLWIDNDEGSQAYWQERAEEIFRDSEGDDTFSKLEQATLALSEALKDEHEESKPELQGFWSDIFNAALGEIDWYEIAENMLEDINDID